MAIRFVAKCSCGFEWSGPVVPKICSVKNVHEATHNSAGVSAPQRCIVYIFHSILLSRTGLNHYHQTPLLQTFATVHQFASFFFFFLFLFASFLLICLSFIFSQELFSTLCCTFWHSSLQDCVIICTSHWNIRPGASFGISSINTCIMTFNNHLRHPCTQHAMWLVL